MPDKMEVLIVKQYNIGKWFGAYYTQMQYSAGYMVAVNFVLLATTVWATSQTQIRALTKWISYPLFISVALFFIFVVLPTFDYMFMMKPRTIYQNSQGWIHDNPTNKELKLLRGEIEALRKELHK